MPLLNMSPNIQDPEAPSRKRTHGEVCEADGFVGPEAKKPAAVVDTGIENRMAAREFLCHLGLPSHLPRRISPPQPQADLETNE